MQRLTSFRSKQAEQPLPQHVHLRAIYHYYYITLCTKQLLIAVDLTTQISSLVTIARDGRNVAATHSHRRPSRDLLPAHSTLRLLAASKCALLAGPDSGLRSCIWLARPKREHSYAGGPTVPINGREHDRLLPAAEALPRGERSRASEERAANELRELSQQLSHAERGDGPCAGEESLLHARPRQMEGREDTHDEPPVEQKAEEFVQHPQRGADEGGGLYGQEDPRERR